jgi:dipeptidyl aminopeptidase/acylaminoacyl peptidase
LAALAGSTNNTTTNSIGGIEVNMEGNLGKYTSTSSKVDAVVDWFGPTDFLIMDTCRSSFAHDDLKSPESSLIGGKIQENKDRCALANPITYIKKSSKENIAPYMIFHGDKDLTVPLCQSERLVEALKAKGVKSELLVVKGGAHGPGVMIHNNYLRMIQFFKNELKAKMN